LKPWPSTETPEILAKNLAAAERLLDAAGAPAEDGSVVRRRGTSTQEWKGFLWNGVPADLVADFFSSYLTHPAARKVNSAPPVRLRQGHGGERRTDLLDGRPHGRRGR
jgi:hypothetical protein